MYGAQRIVRVVDGGLLSSVQDLGRAGVGWMGVSPAGVADGFSARIANRLVYNDDNAALLETTMTGMTLALECDARVAVTGARCMLTIGGRSHELWRAHDVAAGETIVVGRADAGLRSYIAFDGGVEVAPVFGSASTDVGAGFGGHEGKRLAAGDRLRFRAIENGGLRDALGRLKPPLAYEPSEIPDWSVPAALTVLNGPHALRIGVHALADLCDRKYHVSLSSNRQALRLEGQPIDIVGGTDVVSEGVCAGCVQVASDGLPLILLSEHHTTGGYAIALCVCAADLPRAAQLAPGDPVRFARASFAEAAAARDALARRLVRIAPLAASARLGGGFFEGA